MPRVPADWPPISEVHTEVYRVPTDRPEADGTLSWSATTVVAVRLRAGPETGLGWTYAGESAKTVVDGLLAPIVAGADPLEVPRLHESMLRAGRNLGREGVVACAVSAVDIALWDLKARLLGLPLADLWGRARDGVPVYGSGGFTTYDDATTRAQIEGWISLGIPRVKIKIGESWGTEVGRDLRRAAVAREVVGAGAELYVDANGAYQRKQAVRVGRALADDYGVTWFEEPVSSDDLPGLREVRDHCSTDVAAGEYGFAPPHFTRLIEAGAVDCLQADVTRCGGYTSWLAVADLVAAHSIELSGHCAPNLHVHAAVTRPAVRHLEWFHDHTRIESTLFDGSLEPAGGVLTPSDGPGHGMTLRGGDAAAVRVA